MTTQVTTSVNDLDLRDALEEFVNAADNEMQVLVDAGFRGDWANAEDAITWLVAGLPLAQDVVRKLRVSASPPSDPPTTQ